MSPTGAVETGNSLYAVQIFWQNDGPPGAAPDNAAAAVQESVPAAD
jgi:hypothetical protein